MGRPRRAARCPRVSPSDFGLISHPHSCLHGIGSAIRLLAITEKTQVPLQSLRHKRRSRAAAAYHHKDMKMVPEKHITTRRGFIATLGFGGVSLYGLWAAYGAAPSPTSLLTASENTGLSGPGTEMTMPEHVGMGSETDVDAFRAEVSAFVDRFSEPDGTVYPRQSAAAADPSHLGMAEMDMSTDTHTDHAGESRAEMLGAIEVLLLAERYYFDPSALRLDLGQTYRFRMLASDVTHGASIQFGDGARMIRLQAGTETELELTFTRPGNFLVYCTSYCGPGHDVMQARITVA